MAAIDYAGFPARKAAAAAKGLKRGIGLSTYIEACGFGPSKILSEIGAAIGFWETAEIRCTPTGSVEVYVGTHNHGQGHQTTFAQLVAERLGVPFENIEIIFGDTDRVQFGMGTYGSRSGPLGMGAISMSCDKIVAKASQIAAHVLQVAPEDVTFTEGVFSATGTNQTVSFPEVAYASYQAAAFPTTEIEPGLVATSHFDPSNFTFPAGCHICEVEIDPETGVLRIVDFVAVDDFGAVANPMIVEGQVHGGLAQGIGQALLEHTVYDAETGQLLTGSYMDYCMPRADDVPAYRVDFVVTKATGNPLGMKGCGEAGAIGATPAVINAICDALDIADIEMPATPERIWRAANQAAA